MSKKRRNWSAQKKSEIVLEILREEQTLSEISKKYEIAQPVLSRWKADFINNMSAVFDKKGENVEKIKKQHEEEKEVLIKKIGELSMDVDFLKKKHEQVLQMRKRKS
jgi:transposase-like protein